MPAEATRITLLVTQTLERLHIRYAEDTILAKLDWYRMGGEVSDRQWRDILGVLKTREGELDLDYLRTWAIDLKVADLLERALAELK
jgi:hypothetical protein